MSFKILLLAADADPSWPEKIRRAVPGAVAEIFVWIGGGAIILPGRDHRR
jgi:hypothetical protein